MAHGGLMRGTWISTPNGGKALIEDLRIGDSITTLDCGDQPILHIECVSFTAAQVSADPRLVPCVYNPEGFEEDGLYLSGDYNVLLAPGGEDPRLVPAAELAPRAENWSGPLVYYIIVTPFERMIVADGFIVEAGIRLTDWAPSNAHMKAAIRAALDAA